MADLEFYKLSMTGPEADRGIRTGMEAGATSGVLLGDGQGGVRAASPGVDYGLPVLKGNGPPTANTAAEIGQHYFNMAAANPPYEYICVGLNSNGFVWIVFGDTGDGFKISGYFASLEALEAAIEAGTVAQPTAGTAYGIGSAPPYDIYVWDAVTNAWLNNGPLDGYSGGSMPPHGLKGQVLMKASNIDFDASWSDVALHGQGAPDMDTAAAFVGQMYVDDSTNMNKLYAATGFISAASGAIASFDDGAEDIPVKSLVVDIEPVQDLNGYDSPWPPGGGKNLNPWSGVDFATETHSTGIWLQAGSYVLSTDNGAAFGANHTIYIKLTNSSGDIITPNNISGEGWALSSTGQYYYGYGSTVLSSAPFELLTDCYFFFGFNVEAPENVNAIQLEAGSTATAYEPYSNICPITGWTGAKVTRSGKNLLDLNRSAGIPTPTEANNSASPRIMDTAHYYIGVSPNNYYHPYDVLNVNVSSNAVSFSSKSTFYGLAFPVSVVGNSQYIASGNLENCNFSFGFYDKNWNYLSFSTRNPVMTPAECSYMTICIAPTGSVSNELTCTCTNIQLELGSTATAYAPYQGDTYDISFPDEAGTVYGGTLDVTNGVLTVDRAEIPSYAGEILSGTWISDRDVYIDGGSPSEGAQVVYVLATPITYQLTPIEVTTLLGVNNIWADTGDVSVTYDGTKAALGGKTIWTPLNDDVELAPGSVTTDKLDNGAVTVEKLGFELPVNNSIQEAAGTVAAVDGQYVTVCSLTVPVDGTYLLLGFLDCSISDDSLYILGLTVSESGLSRYVRGSMYGGGGMVNAMAATLSSGEVVQLLGYSTIGTTYNFAGKLTLIRLT